MGSILHEPDESEKKYLESISDLETQLKFDPITYKHSLKVAGLSVQLLKNSRFLANEIIVYYAGLFHDIGKSLMPLEILNKEAPLTRDEFNLIKDHAKQGFRILQEYQFPSEILFAALLHHEKYDGSGYPVGFSGSEIPVIARIISICDTFDALTSDRPYRQAYTVPEALNILKKTKEQFDPQLIEIFIAMIEKNRA